MQKTQTSALVILAFLATAAALAYTRSIVLPFVLAVFLSYIFGPLVDLIEVRLKAPRWLALMGALFVGVVSIGLVGILVFANVQGLIDGIDVYRDRFISIANSSIALLNQFGVQTDPEAMNEALRKIPVFGMLKGAAGQVLNGASSMALVLIFMMFLMSGRRTNPSGGIYREIDKRIRQYLTTKMITSATTGVLTGTILAFFGVELAFMFGVLAFLLNFIPTLGSILATVAPIPVVLLQFQSPVTIIFAIALPAAVQFVIGNVLEPRMMGESLGLHPATIMLSLMFWGLLWGTTGMILAVPITAVAKIALERMPSARWLANLLAGQLPNSS